MIKCRNCRCSFPILLLKLNGKEMYSLPLSLNKGVWRWPYHSVNDGNGRIINKGNAKESY